MDQVSDEIRSNTKNIINRSSAFFLVLVPVSLFLMIGALMSFDAPGSEESIPTILFAYSIILYPLVYIISVAISWVLYFFKQYRFAILMSKLPLVNVLAFIIGILSLLTFCGGRFVCKL